MQTFFQKTYGIAHSFIKYISLVLTGLLLLSGLVCTAYSIDMNSQEVLYTLDNPILTVAGSGLMGIAFCLISRLFTSATQERQKLLRILVLIWYIALNLILFLFSKTAPSGDCYSVYGIAESLAAGDTSVIHPTDSYLSYYPQQIGLIAFYEVFIRLWKLLPTGLHAYHFIKIVNMALGCVIILFQEKIVHLLWKDKRADALYLIMAAANCPLLLYTSFIYGELPSYAALCAGLYFLLKLLLCHVDADTAHAAAIQGNESPKHMRLNAMHRTLWLSLSAIALLAFSVMLRKNNLIFMIAVCIVVLLWAGRQKRYNLIGLAALLAVCSLTVLPITENYYEHRSGNTIGSGVTASSYFAMGMQESSRANGWYNGFNFNTYKDSGMNTELADTISKSAISDRLDYFAQNPGYAATFYLEKYLSQWTDGSYACRQATLATFGGRRELFVSLYEGSLSHGLIAYCNFYQNIIYLGAFVYCLTPFLKKREKTSESNIGHSLPAYIGLIAVLGGFLFHMIWEANSRYILLYGLTMLPFATKGFGDFTNYLICRASAFKSSKLSFGASSSDSE